MNNWVKDKTIAAEMLRAANGDLTGFRSLELTEHFESLNAAFLNVPGDITSILDLGCGAAEFGRIYKFFDYTGADLKHVIENVAKKKNPSLNYINFNAYESDFKFISGYDLILINAFISEVDNADIIFQKILDNSKKYVLIHRQKIEKFEKGENDIKYVDYTGYLNKTYSCSIFSENYFYNILKEKGYDIIVKIPSKTAGEYTFLIERRK